MSIKKIICAGAAVFLFLALSIYARAESSPGFLSDSAVSVAETDNSIDIYARFAMKGEVADDFIGNTTYEQLFVEGIKEMWEGEYNGKKVNVHAMNVCETDHVKKILVTFNDVTSEYEKSWANKQTGRIQMFTSDGRSGIFYDGTGFIWRGAKRAPAEQFKYTSGHEFGHILGLADVYLDKDDAVRKNLETPMKSSKCKKATDADYYTLLTHKTWLLDNVYQYSDDKDIYKFTEGDQT